MRRDRMSGRMQAINAVMDYLGVTTDPKGFKTSPDPKVPGCWALMDADGNGYLIAGNLGHAPTGEDVEEVEFNEWPPKSGEPKFFI